jgi:chromosome segregation ATPase
MSKTATKDKKQRPGELRREVKRIENSRDNLKKKSKDKSVTNKSLSGALDDTRKSRAGWRKKAEDREIEIEELNKKAEDMQKELDELNAKVEQYMNEQIKSDETITSLLEDIKKKSRLC